MSPAEDIKAMFRKSGVSVRAESDERMISGAMEDLDKYKQTQTARPWAYVWSVIMKNGTRKLAVAAVIAAAAIICVNHFTGSFDSAAVAWGQEMLSSLETVEAVVYRQRSMWAGRHGGVRASQGWERRYNTKDMYRRDRYDDGVNVMNTQWVWVDGDAVSMLEVSYQYECYFERQNERYGFDDDLVESLRNDAKLLDRADRVLGEKVIDGRQCTGFEISAARYGDNYGDRLDRIWIDVETKLPASIERHGIASSFDAGNTLTIIHDQFEYYTEVSVDMFTPVIPEGFVNTHPDEIRSIRDKEQKGEMVFANVPAGLKKQIVSALKEVGAVVFRYDGLEVLAAEHAWRRNSYDDDGQLVRAGWYVYDRDTLTKTWVDFANRTYRVAEHDENWRQHPIDRILFVAGLIDKADRMLDEVEIEGVDCFGFEVSAKKYGDNSDDMKHRVWFDAVTRLPVRFEYEWTDDEGPKMTVKDRFEWDVELDENLFVPKIPDGFSQSDRL